jgi:hypothetical protein
MRKTSAGLCSQAAGHTFTTVIPQLLARIPESYDCQTKADLFMQPLYAIFRNAEWESIGHHGFTSNGMQPGDNTNEPKRVVHVVP